MPTITLEVTFHANKVRALFGSMEDAQRELVALREKLAVDRFKRNDKDGAIHTIGTPSGPLDVVIDKIESARIIDQDSWTDLGAEMNDRLNDINLSYALKERRALLMLNREFESEVK